MVLRSDWLRQGIANAPFQMINPRPQRGLLNANTIRPVSHIHRHAIMGQYSRSAFIPVLLCPERPPNIRRPIVSVVVDPVDAVFWGGPQAQIAQELRKTQAPSGTDLNASTAVVGIRLIRRIVAAMFHVSPCAILRRSLVTIYNASRVAVGASHWSIIVELAKRDPISYAEVTGEPA